MKNLKKRWKLYGVAYFTALFTLTTAFALAELPPPKTYYSPN